MLQTINPTVESHPLPLLIAGVVVLVAVYGIYTALKYRVRFRGLGPGQKRHVKALVGQRADQSPRRVKFDRGTVLKQPGKVREKITEALETPPNGSVSQEGPKVRDGVDEIRGSVSEVVSSLTSEAPTTAVRLLGVALIDIVFGAVVIVSIEKWQSLMTGGGGLEIEEVVEDIQFLSVEVLNAIGDLIFFFPYADVVWGLVTAATITAWTTLYDHPFVTAGTLAIVAVVIVVLDHRVQATVDRKPRSRDWPFLFTGTLLSMWAIGVSWAAIGHAAGVPTIGSAIGAIVATFLGLYIGVTHTYRWARSVRFSADWLRSDGEDWRTVAILMIAKRCSGVLVALTLPVATVYIGVALITGKLFDVLGLFLTARPSVQGVVILLVLMTTATAVVKLREELTILKRGLEDALSERRVRLAIFGQGLPIVGIGFAYVTLWSLDMGAIVSVGGALLLGIGTHLLYILLTRAKYRVSLREPRQDYASTIVNHVYTVEDADGRERNVVVVNGTDLAHTDQDELIQAAVEANQELANGDEISPKIATHFARHLFDLGITFVDQADVDADPMVDDAPTTEKKLKSEVRRAVFGSLKNNGGRIHESELGEQLENHPDSFVDQLLDQWKTFGTSEGKVLERGEYYVLAR